MADQNELQKKTPVVNVYDTSINTLHATNVDRIQAQANQINAAHVNTLHFHLHVETGSQPQEKRKQNLGIPAAGDTPSFPGTRENIIECGDDKIIFDVDRKIGDRVYVGRIESSIRDEKEYAVKLRAIDSSVSEAEFRAKYLKEVEIANKLDDRVNVARYKKHHVGRIEQELTLFLVTQLCKHEKWENLLPKFTIEQKKILLIQLCHGLEYIHDNQISHRDLKPSNMLLSLDGKHIKIIDFGISKEFALNKHTITTSSGFSGTLGWVASEMCSDDRSKEFEAWVKADIYSLGLLIYFIFTDGKHPYKGDCCDKHQKIKNKEQPDFSVIENDEEFHDRYLLIDLLTAMLSHEPNARPGITEILQHCFTWDVVKKMSFIKDCHRYFVKPCDEDWGEAKGKAKRHLEHNGTMEQKMAYVYKETIDFVQPDSVSEGAPDVEYDSMPTEEKEQPPLKRIHDIIRGNWIKFMKEKLEDPNSGNSSSYGNSFADLVCYIRNTHENYDEKPTEVKRILCSRNEGMWNFFASNFPEFFIYLFLLMKNELKEDDENRYLQERAKNCELPQK